MNKINNKTARVFTGKEYDKIHETLTSGITKGNHQPFVNATLSRT